MCNELNSVVGIEFTDEVMQIAVSVTKKLDNFINDCDNCVAGRFKAGEIDENLLFAVSYQFSFIT